jgi:hypothetical protein
VTAADHLGDTDERIDRTRIERERCEVRLRPIRITISGLSIARRTTGSDKQGSG